METKRQTFADIAALLAAEDALPGGRNDLLAGIDAAGLTEPYPDDVCPEWPYPSADDLLRMLIFCGDELSEDGQRWLLRMLSDAYDEQSPAVQPHLLPLVWQEKFDAEQQRWADEELVRDDFGRRYDAWLDACAKDD